MGLLRKFQQVLPRPSLLTIYKTFIIYDQVYNSVFHGKFESIQYNSCLAITAAVRD